VQKRVEGQRNYREPETGLPTSGRFLRVIGLSRGNGGFAFVPAEETRYFTPVNLDGNQGPKEPGDDRLENDTSSARIEVSKDGGHAAWYFRIWLRCGYDSVTDGQHRSTALFSVQNKTVFEPGFTLDLGTTLERRFYGPEEQKRSDIGPSTVITLPVGTGEAYIRAGVQGMDSRFRLEGP
jgi:hypothetical protein